jgi:imidazolonepropionase-like amidohydrolase
MPIPLIVAAGLALSAGGSIAQTVSGATRASRARKALENFQRQELKNVTEGMRVSTLGAELQTQEAQRRFATSVEALRAGGVRGLVGGLGSVEQQQQAAQQQIAAGLDVQQQQIEQARAQDEANIRAMQEQRESSQIAGLGAEIAAGRQLVNAGLQGLVQTGLSAATMGLGTESDKNQ